MESVASSPVGGRASNFELWSWLFMRVSAIVLVVMVLLHFFLMHILTPSDQTTFSFVADRWSTPFWRLYDLVLLSLALLHGMNGVRVVADDLIHSKGWRVFAMALLYILTFLFLVIGAEVILTFQPGPAQ